MAAALTEEELIVALEKALPEIHEEHQLGAEAWNPHDFVPWDRGRNFAFLGGTDFDPAEATLSGTARAALLALLLTKDQTPSYHRVLALYFPAYSDWRQLVGVWTAEDYRHAILIRDYLVVTRAIDPVDAEDRRLAYVTKGYKQRSGLKRELGPMDVLAMMAVHENQTAAFGEKLSAEVEDEVFKQLMTKVVTDDLVQASTFQAFLMAGMVADQNTTVIAVDKALTDIEPIGFDIDDFDAERELIADFENDETRRAIAAKIADELKLDSVAGLSDEAEAARQHIFALAGRG